MKSKLTKVIILILVIIVIIAICNYIIKVYQNSYSVYEKVVDIDEYYEVTSGVKKFYSYYVELFGTDSENEINKTSSIESIYSLLDKEYLEFSGITKENLKEKIVKYNVNLSLQINSVERLVEKEDLSLYLVKATLYGEKEEKLELLLKKYDFNNSFSIYLSDYIQDKGYNMFNIGDKVKIKEKLVPIETNVINLYEKKYISEREYVEDIFEEFRQNCMHSRKQAYKMLDESSKTEKFDTFEKFDKYIKDNIIIIVTMELSRYTSKENNGVDEYTCYSTKGTKYIFKTTAPMEYKSIIVY